MRLIADKPGGTRFVGDTEPLPVTIAGDVPFYLAGDVAYFTTELDPCAFRRAFEEPGIGSGNVSSWLLSDAQAANYKMPGAKGVVMDKNGSLRYIESSNGLILATIERTALDSYAGSNTDVLTLKTRTVPIDIRLDRYIPSAIHVFAQSSLGGQNNTDAQNQVAVILIGAAYPHASDQTKPDLANSRWYILNINQGNYTMYGRVSVPNLSGTDQLGGLSPGVYASGVCYSIPAPNLSPPMLATPPTTWWYLLIRPGYANLSAAQVQHPFTSITVECEVIP